MQDDPGPAEILAAIAAFLRQDVLPELGANTAYQTRVAANALDLVARQITLAAAGHAAEWQRLRALLGQDGTLAELNTALAQSLAAGTLPPGTPGLAAHLWATTAAKLAVDQPNYSGYRASAETIGRYARSLEPPHEF